MNKEGVEFVYFNHGGKSFEIVKISPAHAHMVIPTERKAHVQPQKSAQQPTLGMQVDGPYNKFPTVKILETRRVYDMFHACF
jgi:hypothetical protein